MANMCSINLTFVGTDKHTISKLHKQMDDLFQKEKHSTLDKLMENHGYKEDQYCSLCSRGDYLSWVDSEIACKDDVYYFSAAAETRWDPHVGPFYVLLKEKYQDEIDFFWLSEECGCEIYEKNDVTSNWYPEQFKVDWAYSGAYDCSYFDNFKETIEFIKDTFPKAKVSTQLSLDKVEDAVNCVYENECPDEDFWIHIYTFKIINDGYTNYRRLKEVGKIA